jgi:TRAP-type mannitol/chloroaromatic compound transport system permease small subunit
LESLLSLSRLVDAANDRIGRFTYWLVLAMTVISALNALMRYGINWSSNGLLEIQWYLFSGVFLLGAGYAMLKNAHVRIDVVAGRLTPRTTAWIEVIGIVVFLLPVCGIFLLFGWSMFMDAWTSREMSTDAGGLVRWPVKLLVPVGFALLTLQALSELVKRVAFLRGIGEWDPYGTAERVAERNKARAER